MTIISDTTTMAPILYTIREILKFKDTATINEISSLSGIPKLKVLQVINNNGDMVYRDRKTGAITKIDTKTKLINKLKKEGNYYTRDSYGDWAHEGYMLILYPDNLSIRQSLDMLTLYNGQYIIEDTKENREKLEALGYKDWGTVGLNDILWVE